ncbi:glycine oxidase ThiO [Rossellomorea aquimaris]|uniref:glycine oxidase n=1 Tax=Rossellomorea aquimaris TaxID=189382 RepID=A0A1J6W2Q9_9BACI|nr:glycine oxidase ThiO [Rossellomorea aquimaris]
MEVSKLSESYDVIIVGAGVIGCSIAYQLSNRQKKVLLLDKNKIGGEASSAAAGMLGVHSEFIDDQNLLRAALKSRDMFTELSRELKEISGIDIEIVQNGMIKPAYSEIEKDQMKEILQLSADVEWLSEEEVSRLEPKLSKVNHGALYAYRDGNVSAGRLTRALAESAVKLGAYIQEYTPVISFLMESGRCIGVKTLHETYHSQEVIVAGGAWSSKILKDAGFEICGLPVKGECFSVSAGKQLVERTIFTKECYIVPKRGNHYLVGATEHPHTFDSKVSAGGIHHLLGKAIDLLPDLAFARLEKTWAGVRPKTDRFPPLIGRLPGPECLTVATGHYRNGILLAPLTGMLMADLIDGIEIDPIFGFNQLMKGCEISESENEWALCPAPC